MAERSAVVYTVADSEVSVLLSLLVPSVFACGGFVATEGALAASDAQQALFDLGGDEISVTYRARYAGNAADFAWVIAVPGQIAEVVEGDGDRLDEIERASAPVVEIDPAADEGAGCGCLQRANLSDRSKGDAGGFGGDTGVVVTGEGFAGDFAYTTLSATDADSLSTWLTDRGYDITLIENAIAAYVEDPLGYEFVAVQLRPEAPETYGDGVALAPLRIRYGAASDGNLHAIFPARLGKSSTVETVRTEIFVLGTGTADLGGGWSAPANPDEAGGETWDLIGADYWDPSGMYRGFLQRLGGEERQMWLAYAGPYTTDDGASRWLTRYDAVVFPSTNTVDPVFTDSGDQTQATTVIYLQEESAFEREHSDTAWLLVPIGLLAGVGLRRRR